MTGLRLLRRRRASTLATGRSPAIPAPLAIGDLSSPPPPLRHGRRTRRLSGVALMDLVTLVLAGLLATLLGPSTPGGIPELVWAGAYCALVFVALRVRRLNPPRLSASALDELARAVGVTATVAMGLLAAGVLVDAASFPGRDVLRIWAFAAVYVGAGRLGLALAERHLCRTGRAGRRTLIIGAGRVGARVAGRLLARPELGIIPVGFLDGDPLESAVKGLDIPVLGSGADLEDVLERHRITHAVFAFSRDSDARMLALSSRCTAANVEVSVVPRLFEQMNNRLVVEHLGGIPLLHAELVDPKSWMFSVKYAVDRALAAVALVALLPLGLLLGLIIKLTSPGPVLFRQARVGVDGNVFEILKFRTMVVGGPGEEHDAAWAQRSLSADLTAARYEADRRTALGRLLRRWSLDELPQLVNVVRGDMSLVGPRPERTSYAQAFTQHVARYGDRHRVRCGLTGWAQVNGLRGETSLHDRVEWDNYYIENWSLWLDLKILLLTVPAMLASRDPG